MAHSTRLPGHYFCCGDHPAEGKKKTSRDLRRKARRLVLSLSRTLEEDPVDYLDHPQDKIRGNKGSRADDWGWNYFGDGYRVYWYMPRKRKYDELEPEDPNSWYNKMKRK